MLIYLSSVLTLYTYLDTGDELIKCRVLFSVGVCTYIYQVSGMCLESRFLSTVGYVCSVSAWCVSSVWCVSCVGVCIKTVSSICLVS